MPLWSLDPAQVVVLRGVWFGFWLVFWLGFSASKCDNGQAPTLLDLLVPYGDARDMPRPIKPIGPRYVRTDGKGQKHSLTEEELEGIKAQRATIFVSSKK